MIDIEKIDNEVSSLYAVMSLLQDEAGNKVKVVAIPETYRFNSQTEDHRRFAWLNVEVKPL